MKSRIFIISALIITPVVFVLTNLFSVYEVIMGLVGIFMITVCPYMLITKYFTEYKLLPATENIAKTNKSIKGEVLFLL